MQCTFKKVMHEKERDTFLSLSYCLVALFAPCEVILFFVHMKYLYVFLMQVKNLASPAMQTSKHVLKSVQAQVLFAY